MDMIYVDMYSTLLALKGITQSKMMQFFMIGHVYIVNGLTRKTTLLDGQDRRGPIWTALFTRKFQGDCTQVNIGPIMANQLSNHVL